MIRILSSRRAILQVISFSAIWILVAAAIRQYHHSTDDTFVPFGKYLLSMRLAVPPLVGLFASYSLLFMSGVTLADAPGRVVRFFRNIFFQTEWMMIVTSVICLLVSGVIFYRTDTEAPPAYTHLITQFLGSENDDSRVISDRIKKLQDDNLKIGDHLDLVRRVFAERKARNLDGTSIEKTTPRNLVRALEANQIDDDWRGHPLRWHALGEAYSMWAQAAQSSLIDRPSQSEVEGLRGKALDAYGKVLSSEDWRATPLMKFSAELNMGNIHLYAGQMDMAEKAYLSVMGKNRNLSTAGNLMALYLMNKPPRINECLELGTKTREWAQSEGKALTEASQYSSVLSTLGYAKLLNGELKDGTVFLLEAHDVVPDMLNSLNLAASLILEARKTDALKVLDQQKQIRVSVDSQVDVCKKLSSQTYYLIRALAIKNEELPDKIAHLLCYLERPTSSVDIQRIASSNPQDILSLALNRLKSSQGSDADFLLIPGFEALFELKK